MTSRFSRPAAICSSTMCSGMLHQPKPAEQEFQPHREVDEAPDMRADDAAPHVLRIGVAPGQHELHVRFQILAPRGRPSRASGWSAATTGDSAMRARNSASTSRGGPAEDGVDRHPRRAVAQALLGAAERLGEHGRRQGREGAAQRARLPSAAASETSRRPRASAPARGRRPCSRARARIALARSSTARASSSTATPASVRAGVRASGRTSATPQRRLHRLHRLADRRLHAAELPRGGGKAAGFGDRDEHAHLVEGQGLDHPSPQLIVHSSILPIAKMVATRHVLCTATWQGNPP